MSSLGRRRFCLLSAAALAARRLPAHRLSVIEPPPASAYSLVAAVDRDRILRLANQWLTAKPQTLTDFPAPNSPGTLHDFFSQADYFWPNPANPNGPWKEIDGKSNPANFQLHRQAMIRLSQAVPALTAGFLLTRREDFARAAAAHLVAWFVTPATRMNPSLEYAQGYPGGPTGRSYGIIDTLHLVEPARAAGFLKDALGPANFAAVQQWLRDYLNWMKTSAPGLKERDATNNHAIAWALQAAEFARLAGDNLTRDEVRTRFETLQLPQQEAANGSFPRELARTKPYGYSIFQFDCATTLGWSLGILATSPSTPPPPPPKGGSFLVPSQTPPPNKTSFTPSVNSRSDISESAAKFPFPTNTHAPARAALCRAAAFLYPYLDDKLRWPYAHDIQHWDAWPVRSPGLLFCGLACDRSDYIALWRRLDPDPTDPEIIRNYPIRQPLLWVA
ncbi:MAG TPA: alginate lyase family protein [Acidobacteriaceae bacterium]|nr:alginate lyase family protein [Acidobacteriaceae bacterium]